MPALPFLVPSPTWLRGRPAWPLPWAELQEEEGGAQPLASFPPGDVASRTRLIFDAGASTWESLGLATVTW